MAATFTSSVSPAGSAADSTDLGAGRHRAILAIVCLAPALMVAGVAMLNVALPFNIGEHYRPDLMDSADHVMLAASARGGHIASLLGFGPDQLTNPAVTAAPVIGMPTTAPSSTSPPPSPAAS